MADTEPGSIYRAERPLTELIAPDHRRRNAILLVLTSAVAGAAIFGFAQSLCGRHRHSRCGLRGAHHSAYGSFDRAASRAALEGVDVNACSTARGPSGPGHVKVVFRADGTVVSAVADTAPFQGTSTGDCVSAAFQSVRVPPFNGGSVRIGKRFAIHPPP